MPSPAKDTASPARGYPASSFLGVLLVACLVAAVFATPSGTLVLIGDVTEDGEITAADAQQALSHAVGLALPESSNAEPNGDANCSGRVTALDALVILSSVVGKDVAGFCLGEPMVGAVSVPEGMLLVVDDTASPHVVVLNHHGDSAMLNPAGITWSSADTTVLRAEAGGRLVARLAGLTNATASFMGVADTMLVAVDQVFDTTSSVAFTLTGDPDIPVVGAADDGSSVAAVTRPDGRLEHLVFRTADESQAIVTFDDSMRVESIMVDSTLLLLQHVNDSVFDLAVVRDGLTPVVLRGLALPFGDPAAIAGISGRDAASMIQIGLFVADATLCVAGISFLAVPPAFVVALTSVASVCLSTVIRGHTLLSGGEPKWNGRGWKLLECAAVLSANPFETMRRLLKCLNNIYPLMRDALLKLDELMDALESEAAYALSLLGDRRTGSIKVRISTTGSDRPAGYNVELARQSFAVTDLDSLTVDGLLTGVYAVSLSGVPDHCSPTPSTPQIAEVVADQEAVVTFTVDCTAITGTLKITSSWTVVDKPESPSLPGSVTPGATNSPTGDTLEFTLAGEEGTATLAGLDPGTYSVAVGGRNDWGNCTYSSSRGAFRENFWIDAGTTTTFSVFITCIRWYATISVNWTWGGTNVPENPSLNVRISAAQAGVDTTYVAEGDRGQWLFDFPGNHGFSAQVTPEPGPAANCTYTSGHYNPAKWLPYDGSAEINIVIACQ